MYALVAARRRLFGARPGVPRPGGPPSGGPPSGGRRSNVARAGVGLLAAAGLALASGCGVHVGATRPRRAVILYGDSLADESQHWFAASFPPAVRVDVHVLGGTAICDFLPGMAGDLARLKPVAVVFEFAGNQVTACTQPSPGVAAGRAQLNDRYRQDAATATRLVVSAGASAWWMGAPVNRDPSAEIGNQDIRSIYQALPQQFPNTHYVDAGQSVERDGEYADTLPCLPEEPCAHINGDQNQVRAADGGHLCPSHKPGTDTCLGWASGAYRFGRAMADPVLASLHLQPARLTVP